MQIQIFQNLIGSGPGPRGGTGAHKTPDHYIFLHIKVPGGDIHLKGPCQSKSCDLMSFQVGNILAVEHDPARGNGV